MDKPELSRYIRERIENEVRWNDLVMEVSERGNLNWEEAIEFIHRVEKKHGGRIHSKRRWRLLVLGVGLAIGGGVLAGYGFIIFGAALDLLLRVYPNLRTALDTFILSGGYLPVPFILVLLGALMVIAGIICLANSGPPGKGREPRKEKELTLESIYAEEENDESEEVK